MIVQRQRNDYQKFLERKLGNNPEVELWADFLFDTIPEHYFQDEFLNWNVFARRLWGFLLPQETCRTRLFSETLHSLKFRNDFNVDDFIEVLCWFLNDPEKTPEKVPVAAYMFQAMLQEPRLVENFGQLPAGDGIING